MPIQNEKLKNAIQQIVKASPSVKVLITSREEAFQIEYYYQYIVHELSHEAALSFLDQKLSSVIISTEEKKTIADLTGNQPLALQLVGSLLTDRVDPPTPASIIEELKTNPIMLLSSFKFSNKKINMLFNMSYFYLENDLKTAACFLALFPGSFDAESVLGVHREYIPSLGTQELIVDKDILRILVTRSLLDYSERTNSYRYHRLFKVFLFQTEENTIQFFYQSFKVGFRQYFLKQLHNHTINFNDRYVESIKFLNSARHNIHDLLQWFKYPELLPECSLLIMVDTVTNAIDNEYLTCRFSENELRDVLYESLIYLMTNMFFQRGCGQIQDMSGTKWNFNEYFQRMYIKLTISYANLFLGNVDRMVFLNISRTTVDILTDNVEHSNLPCLSPPRDPKHHDSLSAKAERRRFYMTLADQYFALSLHQDVISCVRSILDDVENCTTEECTYQHIGYIFWNVGDYEKAGKYFNRSLEIESLNIFQTIDILVKLPLIDEKLKSENLFDVDVLIDACHQVADKCNDEEFLYFWRTIIKCITVVNKAGKNVTFLEDKLFSIVSTSKQKFQLHPKEAFEFVDLVKQANNFTKTIQWGSLIVKPFQNYDNFTAEEQMVILQIRLALSLAKFRLYHFSEALHEMESILDAVSGSPAIQNEQIIGHINDTICSYMLLWPGKYHYFCYRKSLWAGIKLLIKNAIVDLPQKCVYAAFVIPFHLYPSNSNGAYYNGVRQSKTNALSERKYSEFDVVLDIITANSKEIIQSALWYVDTFQAFLNNNGVRLIMNTITVCIRLWLLLSALFTIVGLAYYTAVVCVADVIEPYYISSIVDPSKSLLRILCLILISDLLLVLIHLLSTILRKCSAWGIVWLQICNSLESCHRNLARIHIYNPVNIEQTIWTSIYFYHIINYYCICLVCIDHKYLMCMFIASVSASVLLCNNYLC